MYDLVIIGGGPGGLTAAIYALRARLKTLVIEKEGLGGQIAKSDVIENYPGFPTISGMELMEKFEAHAKSVGMEVKYAAVESISSDSGVKVLSTTEGEVRAKAVIVATGAKPRMLGVPGEKEFFGKGVSYCATCDGPFFRNQEVVVVGGGDTAVKDAFFLSKLVKKVYLVHRRDELRAEKILQEKVIEKENIEILWSHVLSEVSGDKTGVTGVVVENLKTKDKQITKSYCFDFCVLDI